jgi:hypothetical protein
MVRNRGVILGSLLLVSALAATEPGIRAQFVGGTLSGIAAKANCRLDITNADALLFSHGKDRMRIDYRKVNTVEYGQNVSRRYAAAVLVSPLLLLSKSRKHFLTLGFEDEQGKQQALVLRVDKGDIRSVLAGLEARTGRRVEYQDDEARKAGKG